MCGLWVPGLAPGTYTLQVHATDAAGNKSGLYQKIWVVAPTPSEAASTSDTGIASGPADGSCLLAHSATYTATSTQPGSAFIVTLNGRYVDTSSTATIRVTGVRPGLNRITIRATANGFADQTPVVRTVYVPRGVAGMTHTRAWKMRHGDQHLFGRYAQTRRHGQTFKVRSAAIKTIVLVAGQGPANGKVRVYLNGRPISPTINLAAPTPVGMAVIPVRTFRTVQHGLITVKVVSTGKVVQLEGIGVASR